MDSTGSLCLLPTEVGLPQWQCLVWQDAYLRGSTFKVAQETQKYPKIEPDLLQEVRRVLGGYRPWYCGGRVPELPEACLLNHNIYELLAPQPLKRRSSCSISSLQSFPCPRLHCTSWPKWRNQPFELRFQRNGQRKRMAGQSIRLFSRGAVFEQLFTIFHTLCFESWNTWTNC